MILVKLTAAMERYEQRIERPMTYDKLAKRTGISAQTLSSIASRPGYKPGLATIEKLCRALDVGLHEMLEMIDDPPKSKRKRKSKAKKKKS